MNYECCVCDLDGTLMDNGSKIPEENAKALRLLAEQGCKVVIATGRTDLMIKEHIYHLGIQTPVIACNGALIRHPLTGSVLFRKRIDPSLALSILEYCDQAGLDFLVYTSEMIYYSKGSKRINIFAAYNLDAEEKFKVPLKEIGCSMNSRDICKILISGKDLSMIEELSLLFNRQEKLTIVSSGKGLIDIMAAGVSKGEALCRLAEQLNIKLEKTVVFGDNFNDISMFKVAGLRIAVANAEDAVKKEADFVTLSNEAAGVSHGIYERVLRNDQQKTKGIIFDMDGVIIDNYKYHCEAWKQFAIGRRVVFTDEHIKRTFGKTNKDIFQEIFGRTFSDDEAAVMGDEKETIYRELYRKDIQEVPGLTGLLKSLKAAGYKLAVASSAPNANIDFTLGSLKLWEWFDAVVHSGMISRGKPDPEIFLKAAELLGAKPENCVVFEDSLAGIAAGVRAEMKVVGVATTYEAEKLEMAHHIIRDFMDITVQDLEEILNKK